MATLTADPVRVAIHDRLATSPDVLSLLRMKDKGVFHRKAPQPATPPLIVYDKQSGVPAWGFGNVAVETSRWIVRGVCFARTADLAERLQAAIDAALTDAPLDLGGDLLLAVYREADVDYPEVLGKEIIQHAGGIYVVVSQRAGARG